MGKTTFFHHIHSLTKTDDAVETDSLSATVSSPYPDNYESSISGGCFTNPKGTTHTHTDSCRVPRTGIIVVTEVGGGSDWWYRDYGCSKCGAFIDTENNQTGPKDWNGKTHSCGGYEYGCGNLPLNSGPYVYTRSCNHVVGETIKYIVEF